VLSARRAKALRQLLLVGSLALVGACNMVVTKDPVFTRADEAGASAMRPGVWDGEPPAGCDVDEAKPLADWPACSNGFVVRGDGTIGEFTNQGAKRAWATTDVVLAAGEPRLLQIHLTAGADDPVLPSMYLYGAFEPTRRDDQGRIVAGRSWIVVCGPPPPDGAKGPDGKPHPGTLQPFAGLTMDSDGTNCTPASPAALRNAGQESRSLAAAKDISASHWVRDGEK
jgi:hypothetical protein